MGDYAGLTVFGALGENEGAGRAVSIIGDINGDGLDDFAVTAPYADLNVDAYYGEYTYFGAGAVYVVFGDGDFPTNINLDDIDGTNGFRINPDQQFLQNFFFFRYGAFGQDVVGLGDVNGDGVDDFGLTQSTTSYGGGFYGEGFYGYNGGEGVAYVIYGGQDFAAEEDVGDLAGFRIDATGYVNDIVALGDVNGDGFADVGVNAYDRNAYGNQYIDFYYLFDYNNNGVYDEDANEFVTTGSISVATGKSSGFVIFGTDQDRVSDPPIADGQGQGNGGPVFDVALQSIVVVPDDAPTTNETIVNTTLLDGGDGFEVVTGRTLLATGYYGFNYGVYFGYDSQQGGIVGLGDLNGDGFADIGARNFDYYAEALYLEPGEELRIVTTREPIGDGFYNYTQTITPDGAFLTSGGDFLILGRDNSVNPFAATVQLSTLDPEVDFQAFLGNDFNPVTAGVGDVSGNDNRDEIALAEFLVGGDPNNPNGDIFTRGVVVLNGSDQPPLSDPGSANPKIREYDLNDVINGQGAFLFDSTSTLINNSTGEVSSIGFDIENEGDRFEGGDSDSIVALGDINGDGIDDFGLTALRFYQYSGVEGTFNRGEKAAYLIFGSADPLTGVIDIGATFGEGVDAADRLAFRVDGLVNEFDGFGNNISGVGDVDGDGINDVIFGAPYTNGPGGGGFNDGAAYVLFGGLDTLAAADAADGSEDGVINVDNLGVNVETGVLPIEVAVRNAGFFSQFQSEGDVGATLFTFQVERSGDLSELVSFDFQVTGFGGSPADGADFVGGALPSGTASFDIGQAVTTVTIEVQGDVQIEPTEDFAFTISNATTNGDSPISIVADETFARIFNDDFPVQFRIDNASVVEGNVDADNRELVFNVRRFGEIDVAASVDFEIQLNSANADDFEAGAIPASGTINFAAGSTLETIVLPIDEDVDIESSESVFARISNAQAAGGVPTQILDGFAVGTIVNDDFPPRIQVFGPGSRFEGDFGFTPFTFTFERLGDTSGVTDVTFDVNPFPAPGDFFAADSNDVDGFLPSFGNTIRFEDGESQKTFTVNVNGDGIIEPRESFEVRITQVQSFNGTTYDIFRPSAIATILNDDGRPPVIPPGVEADVFGDPHIVTLDGLGYDFQAVGEYILVETEDGAVNPFQVQVRFEPLPGSDLVSTTTRMAVEIDGVVVEIDALGADTLLVDGLAPSANELALGAIDVNGDGVADVFIDAATGMFTIVLNDENEQLIVKNIDGALNVCVFLADSTDGNAGNVRGLMGDGESDGTADDLALRDGTVLPQPLDFDTLYGAFADSWRLDDSAGKEPLFSNTVAFPDGFPKAVLTIDDLPADLRAQAEAAAIAAGFDPDAEPAIFEAAVLDFALTGNDEFLEGALGLAAEQTDETEPENAPDLPATVTVTPGQTTVTEGDSGATSVLFTFFRFGDVTGDLTVDFSIGGDVDATDLSAGTAFVDSVSFADGESSKSISIGVEGDLTTEADEKLTVNITGVDVAGALIGGSKATTTILTDDFAPEAADDEFSTNEDTRVTGNVLDANPDVSDADADGDSLTVTSVTDSGGTTRAANGGLFIMDTGAHLRINGDGSFTYDPFGFAVGGSSVRKDSIFDQLDAGEIATETFTYTIDDGNGGTDTATVSINVTGINDAPFAQVDALNVSEDDVSGTVNVIDGSIEPDFDPEGGDLKVTKISLGGTTFDVDPTLGATINLTNGGRLEINQAGDAELFTEGAFEHLGEQAFGQLTQQNINFTYTVEDEGGLTANALLQVFVKGVNDGPEADDDEAEVDEDNSTLINVLINDFDAEGDTLAITDVGAASGGDAVEENGQIRYTPFTDFFGEDTFTYTITDAGGETSSATVTVNVLPINDKPFAVDDVDLETPEDTSLLIDVLANDIDPDDDLLTISDVAAPSNGVAEVQNGQILYTPNANFFGTDTFTYTIDDGNNETDTATVSINVLPVNDAPEIISPPEFSLEENTTFVGPVVAQDADVDDVLTFSIVTIGAPLDDGALFDIDPATGVLSFIDAPDFESPQDVGGTPGDNVYSLTVAVTDGQETATQSIEVTVTDVEEGDLIIPGTPGNDTLLGSEADEIFESLGGRVDRLFLGGGVDTVRIGSESDNGLREREFIFDFGPDDFLDLGAATIVREINTPSLTLLQLSGDSDLVYLVGVSDFDEQTQLIGVATS